MKIKLINLAKQPFKLNDLNFSKSKSCHSLKPKTEPYQTLPLPISFNNIYIKT